MRILFYARRQNGIHGFLKLGDDLNPNSGEEIHFRTGKSIVEVAMKAFGMPYDSEGKAMKLVIKHRDRREGLLDLTEIIRDENSVMKLLWDDLKLKADEIDKLNHLKSGYSLNCHTLTFDLLESVGLKAPRAEYEKEVSLRTQDDDTSASPRP